MHSVGKRDYINGGIEMKNVLLGELIKQRRTDRKMTQSELSEGICSITTISRIESGERFPDYDNLQKILQRLGLDDDLFYGLRNQTAMKISALQEEIQVLCINFQHITGADRDSVREITIDKIQKLEEMVTDSDHLTRQFLIHVKLILGKEDGVAYNFEERLDMLLKAIRLTVPRFDLKKINDFVYYFNEIKIINQIALTFSRVGRYRTADNIFRQLLEYIENHNQYVQRSAGYLPLIAHNYARTLALAGRYADAIEIGERGRKAAIKHRYYDFLGCILHTMAECYHYLNQNELSADLFVQAYNFYRVIDDQFNLELIKADAERCCGISFRDYCPVSSSLGSSPPSSESGEIPGSSVPSLGDFW